MIKLNNHQITPTIFPDGTSQIWQIPEEVLAESLTVRPVVVEWEFESEAEFMHLAQLKRLLDIECAQSDSRTCLYLPYLPYGRQDKPISNETTFALRVFAGLLNSLGFYLVEILDPHSDVAIEVINHCIPKYPRRQLEHVGKVLESHLVCYPDEGARSKYTQIYDFPYIAGEKIRDQSTGYISHYALTGDPRNSSVLIIDDICDGGATFTRLADALLDEGAISVDLFVTHGIFSRGLKPLHDAGIGRIFTHKGEAVQMKDTVGWKPYEFTKATT